MLLRHTPHSFGSAAVPPLWFRSANPAAWDWAELAGTNVSALSNSSWTDAGIFGNTGPASIVNAWNGTCCDTRDSSIYFATPGGDQDYAGNPVISIRLKDDVPAFAENLGPTAAALVNAGFARNADDTPDARHTYYTPQFIKALNRLFLFGGAALYNNNAQTKDLAAFNPTTGLWDASGTFTSLPQFPGVDASIAQDPTTEDVLVWGGPYLYRFIAATQTWVGINTSAFDDPVAGGFLCVDTRRNRALYAGGSASTYKTSLIDLSNNTIDSSSAADLSGANAADITGTGLGAVFHRDSVAANDCFLVRGAAAGGTVYRINAATLSVDTLTTSGGGSIPAVVTGPYSRFIGTGDLGGGIYGCLLIPTYTSNAWFLRTK